MCALTSLSAKTKRGHFTLNFHVALCVLVIDQAPVVLSRFSRTTHANRHLALRDGAVQFRKKTVVRTQHRNKNFKKKTMRDRSSAGSVSVSHHQTKKQQTLNKNKRKKKKKQRAGVNFPFDAPDSFASATFDTAAEKKFECVVRNKGRVKGSRYRLPRDNETIRIKRHRVRS